MSMIRVGPGRDRWTLTPAPRRAATLRLLCFHHAGGGAYGYRPWIARLRGDVELIAVQLPGRENRHDEPLLHHADAVLDGLVAALNGGLGAPYAMFGHSLGAMLAHRLACRVRRTGELPAPIHLFLSAARPPKLAEAGEPAFERPTPEEAVEQLKRFGGTPDAVLSDPQVLRAFMPTLLADYEILARLRRDAEAPLDIPFTLFKGDADPTLKRRHLNEWQALSLVPCTTHVLPGGHFYPPSSQSALLDILNAEMDHYI